MILILLFCSAAFWFVSVHGRGLVIAELERATGKKVTLRLAHPVFPAGFVLKDLHIEGLAKIPKAIITVHMRTLLGGRWEIASLELQSPEVNISLSAPVNAGEQTASSTVVPVEAAQVKPIEVKKAARRDLLIDRVMIRNGIVMVQAPATGKTWILEKVQADLGPLSFDGSPGRVDFVVGASLARMNIPFVGHLAKARGWVNWAARDMEANVEALDEDGRVGLSAVLTARANDCIVKGRALLSSSQAAQATDKKPKMIEATVLGLLDSFKTDIAAEFSFRTPLDRFEVGKVSITGNITTGLQTEEISGNIVGSLKAAGARLLEKDNASLVKP